MSKPTCLLLYALLVFTSVGAFAQEAPADQEPRRLGVVGFYNPRLMYIKYQPLADYLTQYTPWRWELAIATTYDETVRELCAGRLALAYLGPFTYVRAHEACGAEPVVRLNTGDSATYRSFVMVGANDPAADLDALRGRRIAFGAPLSMSSHVAPRAMLQEAGLIGGADYDCVYFDHHDRAARAVLLGDAEACAVRDTIGQKFLRRGLRLLARTDPIPNFPFVTPPNAGEGLRDELLDALVKLPASDSEIAEIFEGWDEELAGGFVPCGDEEFEPVRALARQVFGDNAMTIDEAAIACAGGAER